MEAERQARGELRFELNQSDTCSGCNMCGRVAVPHLHIVERLALEIDEIPPDARWIERIFGACSEGCAQRFAAGEATLDERVGGAALEEDEG